jgi:vancomycin resistance protein VanJ
VKRFISNMTAAFSRLSLLFLFGWLALYSLSGDRFALVSVLNMVAVYLFTPLPFVLGAALLQRKGVLIAASTAGLAAFAWLWGGLLLPAPTIAAPEAALKVMTYNTYGWRTSVDPAIDVIREENADVVLLQELSPLLADALEAQLGSLYPYQVLAPVEGVTGMGVISRHPLRTSSHRLPLEWLSEPQVLEMDWNGEVVTLVNFHATTPPFHNPRYITPSNRHHEKQASALAELGRQTDLMIAAGDANATPQSDMYRIITTDLQDAWQQAGFGFGHTYPGRDRSARHVAQWWRVPVPEWLARIDYIFASPGWQTVSVHTARPDGYSDHRGVVAVLAMEDTP